jgi:hypothetical protein
VFNPIRSGGSGKIRFHLHRQQQPLRPSAFVVRHTDAVKDFQINDGDFSHDV